MNNCIRVRCFLPFHNRYILVDTKDHVSMRLFSAARIRSFFFKEMSRRHSPYRLIICYVRKKDLNKLDELLEQLRNSILLLGYKDYDKVCNKLKEAERVLYEQMRQKGSKNVKFYLLYDHLLGKEEDGKYYLFKDKKWIPDSESVIMDHLVGYDSSEPEDSPYVTGCTSIMDEIQEISYETATNIMGEN